MKLLFTIILICCQGTTQAQKNSNILNPPADENTLLWRVSGNGLTTDSYLFGTFHLLCKDEIIFSKTLKNAVAGSKAVYLELDLDDPATLMDGFMLMGMKEGKKLKDLYTSEAYKRLEDFFKDSLKIALGVFQNIKPEFLVALLYPAMMPCHSSGSVEEALMDLAKASGKEIKGLETMAFQASLFDSIPYEKQAEALLEAIDSLERSKTYFALMLDAYKKQQLDKIEQFINNPEFGVEENQDMLLDKRNMNWINQLKEIMKTEPVFVAVGAGHLVGKNGLIALLRAEGYSVRGVENNQ